MCQFLVANTSSYQSTECVAWNIHQVQEQPEWPTTSFSKHVTLYEDMRKAANLLLTAFCYKVPSWWVAFEAWSCPKFRGQIGEIAEVDHIFKNISKQVDLNWPQFLGSPRWYEPKPTRFSRRILWMSQHWLPRGGLCRFRGWGGPCGGLQNAVFFSKVSNLEPSKSL